MLPPLGESAHPTFRLSYSHGVARFAIDVTACWRPLRVGMLTVAVELTRALVNGRGTDEFVLICSRDRPDSLRDLDCEAVFSPHRHELAGKSRSQPAIEPFLDEDGIRYPDWSRQPLR